MSQQPSPPPVTEARPRQSDDLAYIAKDIRDTLKLIMLFSVFIMVLVGMIAARVLFG